MCYNSNYDEKLHVYECAEYVMRSREGNNELKTLPLFNSTQIKVLDLHMENRMTIEMMDVVVEAAALAVVFVVVVVLGVLALECWAFAIVFRVVS